jgi:mannose/fructose-specific phosphotransferase system component IIA
VTNARPQPRRCERAEAGRSPFKKAGAIMMKSCKLIANVNILIVYSQIDSEDSDTSRSNINANISGVFDRLVENAELEVNNLKIDDVLPITNILIVDS